MGHFPSLRRLAVWQMCCMLEPQNHLMWADRRFDCLLRVRYMPRMSRCSLFRFTTACRGRYLSMQSGEKVPVAVISKNG
jgi:hypothetical protein